MSRKPRLAALTVAVSLLGMGLCPMSIAASQRGYDIWFVGQIRSIDGQHGRIRIARGPTETADAAIVECDIPRRALRHLRVGMDVSAEADTRRVPWHIFRLRLFERIPQQPGTYL